MSSVRDRQRAAARAKLEREMAARAEAARRRRQRQLQVGGAALAVLVLVAAIWLIVSVAGGGDKNPSTVASASPVSNQCTWNLTDDPNAAPSASPSASAGPSATASASPGASAAPVMPKWGLPPTTVPTSGHQLMTITTNQGVVKVDMDLSKTPCTAASFAHLASKGYFNKSSCHRLVAGIFALQCGDPTFTGSGGPGYQFADENLPVDKMPRYHEGDVAMANGGPGTNGSQFFFIYGTITEELKPDYSLWGKVVSGMDVIKKVAAGGDDGAFEAQAGGGHPKVKLEIQDVTVGPVTSAAATPSP